VPTLEDAIKLAMEAHYGQSDPLLPDEPYILHALRVMQRLRDNGEPENVQAAGVLHDILERSDITPEQMLEMGWSAPLIGSLVSVTRQANETLELAATRSAGDPVGGKVRLADVYDRLRPERLALLTERQGIDEIARLEGVRHILTRADVFVP
jgi:hypothetical protein